jgi:hypothetical protein
MGAGGLIKNYITISHKNQKISDYFRKSRKISTVTAPRTPVLLILRPSASKALDH